LYRRGAELRGGKMSNDKFEVPFTTRRAFIEKEPRLAGSCASRWRGLKAN